MSLDAGVQNAGDGGVYNWDTRGRGNLASVKVVLSTAFADRRRARVV